MFVALVKSCSDGEKLKLVEPGRPFTRETTTSPFSRGTILDDSVEQIWSSSLMIRAFGDFPKRSKHSRLELAKYCQAVKVLP